MTTRTWPEQEQHAAAPASLLTATPLIYGKRQRTAPAESSSGQRVRRLSVKAFSVDKHRSREAAITGSAHRKRHEPQLALTSSVHAAANDRHAFSLPETIRPRWQWRRGAKVNNNPVAATGSLPADDENLRANSNVTRHAPHFRRARLLRVRIRRGQQLQSTAATRAAPWEYMSTVPANAATTASSLHRPASSSAGNSDRPALSARAGRDNHPRRLLRNRSTNHSSTPMPVPLAPPPLAPPTPPLPAFPLSSDTATSAQTALIIVGTGIVLALLVVLLVWLACHVTNKRYQRRMQAKEQKRLLPVSTTVVPVAVARQNATVESARRDDTRHPPAGCSREDRQQATSSRRPSARVLAVASSSGSYDDGAYTGPKPAVTVTSPSPTPVKSILRNQQSPPAGRQAKLEDESPDSDEADLLRQPLLADAGSEQAAHTPDIVARMADISTAQVIHHPQPEVSDNDAEMQDDSVGAFFSVSPKIEGEGRYAYSQSAVFCKGQSHPLLHPHFHSQSSEDFPITINFPVSVSTDTPMAPDAGTRLSMENAAAQIEMLQQEVSGVHSATHETPGGASMQRDISGLSDTILPTPWPPPGLQSRNAPASTQAPASTDTPASAPIQQPTVVCRETVTDPCIALWELRSALENSPSPVSGDDRVAQTPMAIRLFPLVPPAEAGAAMEWEEAGSSGQRQRQLLVKRLSSCTTTDECYASTTTPVSDDALATAVALQLQRSVATAPRHHYAEICTASESVSACSTVPVSLLTSLTSFESNTPSEESFDASSCARAIEAIFDEPSDLPVGEQKPKPPAATHLTPPVNTGGRQKVRTITRLTSQQKRQSFKKAHRSAVQPYRTPAPASEVRVAASTSAAAGGPMNYRAVDPVDALLLENTRLALAAMATSEVTQAVTTMSLELTSMPVGDAAASSTGDRAGATSPSRLQLQHMKSDSGYKSQSFDATCSAGHAAQPPAFMHSFKSVPVLPLADPQVLESVKLQSSLLEQKFVPNPAPRDSHLQPVSVVATATQMLLTSSEYDEPITDCSFELSDALLSLTSSTDQERSISPRLPPFPPAAHPSQPIPLLLHPATPTSPSAPKSRDWSIDAQSDRLFREFSGPALAASSRYTLTVASRSGISKRRGRDPLSTRNRDLRAALKHAAAGGAVVGLLSASGVGSGRRLKRSPFSASSSHSGTPAQQSIEETEEEGQEQEQDSQSTSASASSSHTTASHSTVIYVPGDLAGPAAASAEAGASSRKSRSAGQPRAAEDQMPDFIICSTKEQLTTQISLRSRSPQLRHVPIIKLPDQESEEV
ncbi:mucin-4-like [Paramacrobiotus metropolitanus]|uniref:mucin-4-like n=1 Tax=Paramacrobiotus metropolitanus TaxID=2943436 RepID=UPI002445A034|nr:mucin-4-like [Paramacrobiotus metropolitanus]